MGWQLEIADLIANGGQPFRESRSVKRLGHSDFAVLQICLSYFETIGHYTKPPPIPTPKNGFFFKEGVKVVFPQLVADYAETEMLAKLYGGARCGLYHNSLTVPGVGVGKPLDGEAIAYDPDSKCLVISPKRLTGALINHLKDFRIQLLDSANAELRQNFESRFDADNGISKAK